MTNLQDQLHIQEAHINTYPSAGPKKGMVINSPLGAARSSSLNKSAIVPAPIAKAGENPIPAKNRKMHSAAMLCVNPAPTVNIAPSGAEIR